MKMNKTLKNIDLVTFLDYANSRYEEELREAENEGARIEKHMCPKCGKTYAGFPAISRVDNKTEICSRCGQMEALQQFGFVH